MSPKMPTTETETKKPMTGIPVTLLSGFLGSGKTTLLKSILQKKDPGMEVAVLVNDMAELNIDAGLVKNGNLLQSEEKIVEMQNGCICCTLREDLLLEMTKLALMRKFDAILIESTGVSEPQQVAETFTFEIDLAPEGDPANEKPSPDAEENPVYLQLRKVSKALGYTPKSLNELARLDTCVTVVDCKAFSGDLTTCGYLLDRYENMDEQDDRNISHLLIDQIEFSNVILLNKCDLVSEREAATVEKAIKVLNPNAVVHKTVKSEVPLSAVMNTGLFDMDKASRSAGWLQSLSEGHTSETEEYGIASFVYRSRVPFHPKRFFDFMETIFMLNLSDYVDEEEEGEEEEEEGKEEEEEEEEEAGKGETANEKEDHERGSKRKSNGNDIDNGTPPLKKTKKQDEPATDDATDEKSDEDASNAKLAHMKKNFGHIYRSKGFIWLGGRDLQFGEWGQAGAVANVEYGGLWVGCMPEELQPKDSEEFKKDVIPGLLDRRQEIVIIGHELKKDKITEALDACLLRKEEIPKDKEDKDEPWQLGYKPKDDDRMPVWPDAKEELENAKQMAEDEEDEDGHGHGHGHHHHHHHHGHKH